MIFNRIRCLTFFVLSIFLLYSMAQAQGLACKDLFDETPRRISQFDTVISDAESGIIKNALNFIEAKEDFVGLEYIYQKNKVHEIAQTIAEIDHLSPKAREYFRLIVLDKYANIKKSDEDSSFGPNEVLIKKRNLEALLSWINRPHLKELFLLLQQNPSISRDDLIRLIDNYYVKTLGGSKRGLDQRGGYSFDQVLTIATILQKNLGENLDSNKYIQIYGSLPNGKSSFKDSDVDLHFSNQLSKLFLTHFAEPDTYQDLKSKSQQNIVAASLQTSLAHAEAKVAYYMAKNDYNAAEVITFKAEDPIYMARFRMGLFGLYNPLIVKIDNNKIKLQVYIGFESRPDNLYSGEEFSTTPQNFLEVDIYSN